ncbi:MAG: hypothetical protein ABIG93_04410 [archaeon]|nr:hypothetical protein [Nanoarchaeota archaeon]
MDPPRYQQQPMYLKFIEHLPEDASQGFVDEVLGYMRVVEESVRLVSFNTYKVFLKPLFIGSDGSYKLTGITVSEFGKIGPVFDEHKGIIMLPDNIETKLSLSNIKRLVTGENPEAKPVYVPLEARL